MSKGLHLPHVASATCSPRPTQAGRDPKQAPPPCTTWVGPGGAPQFTCSFVSLLEYLE